MDRTISLGIDAPREHVFVVVADLGTYPKWMKLVHEAEPAEPVDGDPGPAWMITLRAKLGPFARSKRLRMVRVEFDQDHLVRFERREIDGRDHANWVMSAELEPDGEDSVATIGLMYDGDLWSGALDGVLGAAIDNSVKSLADYVTRS